ncbi:hypothetical protein [Synechococcus sp. Ace-Pa]|uniref:hypothetical protein n=1 Tax=Synechococcus sp. Ace-Pa TaxID=2572902 RepID=UPI001646090D|nr:hypothetical protein [Synechococcus sp. Ace-Pa]
MTAAPSPPTTRGCSIRIRASAAERDSFHAIAAAHGMTLSEALRAGIQQLRVKQLHDQP